MDTGSGSLHSLLLLVHVTAGATGLVVAWPTLAVPKRRGAHVWWGRVYMVAVVTMCVTALALVASRPAELAGLGFIAVATLACALGGLWMVRRRPRLRRGTWLIWHLNLMGSSVISFVTAFAVQMTDGHPLAWIVPTIVGSPLIARRTAAAQRGRPPRPRVELGAGAGSRTS
ncbi:MAG: hypothetical protein ACR2MA_01930 [Egibacteraceae bacterium]